MLLRRGTLLFFKVIRQMSRSRGKKASILTQIGRFRTVTPVWIHQWLRNDTQSLKYHGRGALLFLKVIRHISRSHGTRTSILTQIGRFQTVTLVWIHWWLWNNAQNLKRHRRSALLFFKVVRQISRSHGIKNCWIWPEFGVSGV